MIPKSASIAIHVYILNSDMKASPTVSDPYPSHPYLSRLRNWPQIVQLSYLFRSMLSLQVQQTLLLAALLLTKIMMMIIRSPKWEIYYLTLWSQLKENWIGGRGWDSSTCKVHLHQSLVEYVRFLLNLLVTCSIWEFWCTALVFRAARLQLIIFKRPSLSCVLIKCECQSRSRVMLPVWAVTSPITAAQPLNANNNPELGDCS